MTTKNFFKVANRLHKAFLAGSVLFILLAVYLNATDTLNAEPDSEFNNIMMIVTLVMGVWGIFGSLFISNRMLKKASDAENLSMKMVRYRGILILRAAITEGAALLGAVAYMLTGNQICLGVAAVCAAFLGFIRPSREEAKRSLQLSSSESMMLDQEEAEILNKADWQASRGR